MGSKLVTVVVIVLGVLAISQLVRLYELSSKLRNRREEDITNRDNKLNANLMLTFMFLFYGFFIYLMSAYGWTGRGDAASVRSATDCITNLHQARTTILALRTQTNRWISC